MKSHNPYPFTPDEQDAIRFFGISGYRFAHETKKAIAFYSDTRRDWIYFNRELPGFNVVIALNGRSMPKTSRPPELRASSNFAHLPKGPTSRGGEQHQGHQFNLPHASHLPNLLTQLNGTVP